MKKLFIVFFFLSLVSLGFAKTNTELNSQLVTMSFNKATLNEVIWEMQKQTDFKFIYSTNDVETIEINDVKFISKTVTEVLDLCLYGTDLDYSYLDGVIAIQKNTATQSKAQQNELIIKGIVVDEKNEPVIGASVVSTVDGNYAITDMDGKFEMKVKENKQYKIEVSLLGFTTEVMMVAAGTDLTISLKPDVERLDEVIVTGYGTYKKSAYAGSASVVKTKGLKDVPTESFAQLLQGSAPGVQISSGSGQPGATAKINIRGLGSFNASNQPLYVIDGVPVISGSVNTMSSDAGLDIMSTISNSDIENITVIKDAAAASLYGSRAANGVIVITTKRGKQGKPVFNFKADWGLTDFAMKYRPVMDGQMRRDVIYEGLIAEGEVQEDMTHEEAVKYADEEIDNFAPVPWCGFVDWEDVLFKKGSHQTYEFSVAGATEKFNYYSSLGYMQQEGIALNSGLDRITARVNVDYQANKWLKLGANVLFASIEQDVNAEGTTYTSPFYSSKSAVTPSDPVYNEDGTWNRELLRIGDRNPRLSAEYDYQKEYVTRAFNTIFAEVQFYKDLKFKTTLSYDFNSIKGKDWSDPRTSNGEDDNGYMSTKFYEYKKLVWTNHVMYNKSINDVHNIDALAGYEIDDYYRDYLSGGASNFATEDKNDIINGMKTEGVSGSQARSRLVSYIAKLNYNYDNKYFIGGSWRLDGSSRLAKDNRWGNFWSASAAWRIDRENFMSEADWVSDLKLRASYGVNGTLPSDYYGYYGLSSLTNGYLEQPGIIQSQIENKNLSWETNYNFNVGVDFGINDRVNFSLEYYNRVTKNLLMDRPISMTTGFSSYLMNIGKVLNQGVEFAVNSINFDRKNFYWSTDFSIGHNENEIMELDGMQTEIISGSQIRKVGMPYRTFYLIEFAGINPENGMPQFYTNEKDENGKYKKDLTEDPGDANYIPYKSADPAIFGGLTNTFRYRWFDLNFMLTYQFGGYSYDNWAQKTEHGGEDPEANIPLYYENRWKQPGDKTNIERFIVNNDEDMGHVTSTRRIHSTDFIRLKNLTVGFTLPQNWTKKVYIDQFRVFFSANNLLTWAKYDQYDPEAVYNGTAIWGTPPLKTFTFGLNINF